MSAEEKLRVLVVDDEPGMREGCRRALTRAGFDTDTASDLPEALALLRRNTYELFLLDVMLPGGSGLDLLDPILSRDPDATCIIITGFSSIEVAVEAIRRGAYNFLSKPFTSDTLLVAVNQAVERRRLKAIERASQELEQAKEELERLDQVKSQLMLKVAHELRAPVAAVQSYVNLVLAGYVSDKELTPMLKRVQERLQEMLDVIADLLELARLKQAAQQNVPTAPVDMAEILREVCDLLRPQAQAKGQEFVVEVDGQPCIVADHEHMRQIWMNLVSNAIKYTPQGGRVSVKLESDGQMLRGTVQDSGIGIAKEDMQNLFQEFFRTEQAKASGQMGTGLGLSIVKQVVDSYQGTIKVESSPGSGSRFSFELPLQPPPTPQPDAAALKEARRRPAPVPQAKGGRTHARVLALSDDTGQEDPSNPAGP
ncbi:MAG: ATP-binding protein [Anaerolineae bacterium]|nr:ATP-binding protein [Anaerolineae bacterium]MDX9833433.1 ATP-binding protein [Anaerolineae bacterium]